MKQRISSGKCITGIMLMAALALSLTACSAGRKSGETNLPGKSSEIEEEVPGSSEPADRHAAVEQSRAAIEMDEEKQMLEAQDEAGTKVTIYHGNDTVEMMVTKEALLPDLTAENLADALIEAGVLEKGVKVNSLEISEKEGMTYLELDFNEAFLTKLNRMGTSGEYFYMGGVVNTFLKAFDAYAVKITVDGKPAESGHNIYSEALRFFRPNPGEITGKYKFVASEEVLKPFVELGEDGRFIFEYSVLMSSIPMGDYELENGRVVMKRQGTDAVYVFDIQGENLVYDKDGSTDTGLEDKAVFEPSY